MSRESASAATKSFVADNGRIHLQQQQQQQQQHHHHHPQQQQKAGQQSQQRSSKSLKTFCSLDETALNTNAVKNNNNKTKKSVSKFDFSSSDDDDGDYVGEHPQRLHRQHHSLTEDFIPNKLKQYHHRHHHHHHPHHHNHPHLHHSNQHRYFRGNFYQVNPICAPTTTTTTINASATSSSESMIPTVPLSLSKTFSSSLIPREPSTSSSSSSSSSSSTTTSPSEASFDLELAFQQQQQQTQRDSTSLESSSSSTYVTSRPSKLSVATSNNNRQHQHQSSKRSTSQQPKISTSTFWDLITDVAKDLDLKLQDLSPDSEIFEQPKSATTTTNSATAESSSTNSIEIKNSKRISSTKKKHSKQHQHPPRTSSSPSASSPSSFLVNQTNQNDNVIGNTDQPTQSCLQRFTKRQQINDGTSPHPSPTPPAPPPRGITSSSCIIIASGSNQDKEENHTIPTTITTTNQTDSYTNQSSSSFNNTNQQQQQQQSGNENERIFDDIINVVSKWNQQRQSQQQQQSIINGNEQQMQNVDIFDIHGQHSSSIISNTTTIAPIEPPPPSPPSPFANRGKRSSPSRHHQTLSGCITVEPPEQFAQCNHNGQEQQQRNSNIDGHQSKPEWHQHTKNMQKQSSSTATAASAAFITDRKTSSKFIGEQFGQQQQQHNKSTRINDFNQKHQQQPRYPNTGREPRKSQQNSFVDTAVQLFESTSAASIPLQRQHLKDQTSAITAINGNVCSGGGLEMIIDEIDKSTVSKTKIDNRTNNNNQSPRKIMILKHNDKTRPMSIRTNSTNAMSKNKQQQQKRQMPQLNQQKVEVKPRWKTGRNMKQDNEGLGQIILGNKPPPSSPPQSSSLTNKLYNDHHDDNGNGSASVDKSSGLLDSTQFKLEEADVGRLKLLNFAPNNCVDGDGGDQDDDDDPRSSASEHLRHPICPLSSANDGLPQALIFQSKRIAAIVDPPTFSTFTSILTPFIANNHHPSTKIVNNIQCQSSSSSTSFLQQQPNNNSSNSNCFQPIKLTNTNIDPTSSFISNSNRYMTNNDDHNISSAFRLVSPKDKTETPPTPLVTARPPSSSQPLQHKPARLLNIEILRPVDNEVEEDEDDGDQEEDCDKDLPEGNVDDDDEDDEDADELNAAEEEEMEDEDDAAAPYEVDADDEQSNDMLDDCTEEDDEYEDEDHGPKSTSPAPILLPISSQQPSSMITKIDLPKSMVQIISMKVNNNQSDHKTTKDQKMATAESEDSAADVSYERTSDNESDVDDDDEEDEDDEETTITTVNTNNVNNVDLKELNFDQRFKMTQTIWYLPHINRATVVHYLQGKTVGVFIVRQSSKPNTMAISVRLPQGRGPHVEHYLIEKITKPPLGTKAASSVFRLEGSEHYFNTIVQLVIHYSNCQDELPVQLSLPSVLLSSTRSQLSSLGLLGQEFWQSKFVSLKQLPKNSLNNETLAMINQNCDEMRSQPPLPMINHLVHHHQQHQRQPPKRHNSNSSESNASKSSMSCSPMPNVRSRRNTSDSASPTTVPKTSPPPPLPPKCDPVNSPLIGSKQPQKSASNIAEDNLQSQISISSPIPMVMIENPTPTTTINLMPKLPPRGNNQSYVPPPVPPRNPRNSPGSTPPPPLPSNGPPISSLRSKKPPTTTGKGSANLQDLLSPMSMTESEIEMAKFQMSHSKHLAPNILEVEEYDENEDYDQEVGMIDAKSKARLNYYNHMVQAQSSSSPLMLPAGAAATTQSLNELLASQTPPPPSLPTTSSFMIPAASPQPLLSLQDHSGSNSGAAMGGGSKCDVCTQTYETKTSLLANKASLTANNGARITRANSSLSCFYMDPIDALVAIHAAHQQPKRHSDPELASSSINTTTNDMDSSTLNQTTFSLSHSLESLLENFRNRFSSAVSSNEFNSIRETILNERLNRQQLLKNIDPVDAIKPMASGNSSRPDAAFSTIDSAWQWHSGNHHHHHHPRQIQQNPSVAARLKVPGNNNGGMDHLLKRSSITTNGSMKSDITTVEDLISANVPELAVPKITHIDQQHQQKLLSCLDNDNSRDRKLTAKSIGTDVGTEFSEPWNLDLVESMFLSELNVGGSQGGSGSMIHPDEEADTTRQLLNNDLINFNSFLLNQEHPNPSSFHQQQQPCEDDYDNVADDEEINNQFLKRDDSEITLKDGSIVVVPRNPIHHHQSTPTNDNGIKLNIAYNISNYVFELASRKDNTFAKSIDNFIECTKETTDPNPSLILGYVRQFMNGMKNYLLKNGEGDFGKIVQNERSRLKPNQFLNIDSILEVSLQKLIIKPLKNFIYELFIRSHTQSGSLKILSTNIKLAQNKTPEELGIRTELLPIEPRIMAEIQKNLRRLQQSYSPIKKMEHLLRCVAILNGNYREKMSKCLAAANGVGCQASKYNRAFSGDDLLPMLVYLIVHCGVISADIESEYMLGLLHPSILNGEGSYYLTILSSAIQVLKTMYAVDSSRQLEDIIQLNNGNNNRQQSLFSIIRSQPSENLQRQMSSTSNGNILMGSTPPLALPSIANLQAYMKIMIPNELTSSITCKTVPVRHNMTTKEVCRMIAHTFRITNPEDYALYRIKENGLEEIQLLDNEYPQVIKSELMARGETPMFAYKRCDAKFIWPITSPN